MYEMKTVRVLREDNIFGRYMRYAIYPAPEETILPEGKYLMCEIAEGISIYTPECGEGYSSKHHYIVNNYVVPID